MEVCFPLHYFSPVLLFFPEKGRAGAKPSKPWLLPALQAGSLPTSPTSRGQGGTGSYRRARDESVSMLSFCSVWLPESKH